MADNTPVPPGSRGVDHLTHEVRLLIVKLGAFTDAVNNQYGQLHEVIQAWKRDPEDKLTHEVRLLGQKIAALAAATNEDENLTLSAIHALLCSLNERLGKLENHIMSQLDDLQVVVGRIDAATTKAGEAQQKEASDVRRIIALLKQPGVDLAAVTAQLTVHADRTEALAQALIDADTEVLLSDTPIPIPDPIIDPGPFPEPAGGRKN